MFAPDLTYARWRKSSRSNGAGNDCVEVAAVADATAVRDSKNATGPVLLFDRPGWDAFRSAAREGHST